MPENLWVDAAQIVSAVATAGSVAVSLWLARRNETPRLRSYPGFRMALTVGPEPRTAEQVYSTELTITVVNSGLLPIRVRGVSLAYIWRSGGGWRGPMDCYVNDRLTNPPLTLQHGEEATFKTLVNRNAYPWDRLKGDWWAWRKIKFEIETSLGTTRKGMPRRVFQLLQRSFLRSPTV